MCLVIVGIIRRPGPSSATKGISITTEILELSDGWYKIKAHLDPVLARVLKRGALRVGFKLAISGASTEAPAGPSSKSSGEKKSTILKETDDGKEEEVRLYLEGNATSRARWPETLGFRPRPWVASLRSLSPDGGRIPLMDIVISKVFPPMFVDQEGRMGRWGIAEENMLQVAWEVREHKS
jgi:breast cancer 2 susceptibility protein